MIRGQRAGVSAFLFAAVYMASYITRINYGAVISELEAATGFSKSLLSMAPMGSFITYGAGQVISGICGDRFSPKKLIAGGLSVTALMNFLLPLCRTPYAMTAVWCVNGFAQAMIWPPLVRMMTALYSAQEYRRASVLVIAGSQLGTVVVYLVSPCLMAGFGWKSVFLASAVCGVLMVAVWTVRAPEVKAALPGPASKKGQASVGILFTPGMLCVMAAIICIGMLRDGVSTWMPSYISETYEISNRISILTGALLPFFGVACCQAASEAYHRIFSGPLSCAAAFLGLGAVASAALLFLTGKPAVLSVIGLALLTGSMHGANLMLISMVPPFFQRYGNVSTVSGVLNACVYIGSAVSTYGVTLLAEGPGWQAVLLCWLATALAGTALCLGGVRPWRERFPQEG